MKRDNVKILKTEVLHQGYCRVERYTLQNRLFAGQWSAPYMREIVRRFNAVAALPYDPIRNQVVLIEQFRAGALWEKNTDPWLLELVAGVRDKEEESVEELVRRESQEEAGLEVMDLIPMCHYLASPGGSSEAVTIFCARVDAGKAPQFCGLPEENEDIQVHVLGLEEAFAALHSGKINNAILLIAMQWLALNLTKVREKWS